MEMKRADAARVFFALWPDNQERAAMALWQPLLQALCGGKPTPEPHLHSTLIFLGDVELAWLEALKLAAEEERGTGFQLVFDTARYWARSRIVYAAPDLLPRQLLKLVQVLEERLQQHQFIFERRDYKPHVTLLRPP